MTPSPPGAEVLALGSLATEQRNPTSENIDVADTLQILRIMNDEDAKVALAVRQALPAVARLVDLLVERFRVGGRLFYVGAGTSGRLGTLDAVECPPTFGVAPDLVQFIMAGGAGAWRQAVEGAEDDEAAGKSAIRDAGVTSEDMVVGIAASGRTPFVKGALIAARSLGCSTGAIANHSPSEIGRLADVPIEVPVGPEVLTGSTRLKAGTAQKLILNMISTAAMIRLGKAYGNLMVDVMATNHKLRDRARRIVADATGLPLEDAARILDQAGGSAKRAILMEKRQCTLPQANALLEQRRGSLREALESGPAAAGGAGD